MATLAQIRSKISRKLKDPNNTANTAPVVVEEINRAVRFYQNYNFGFNETLADLVTVQGQQRLSGVPGDVLKVLTEGGIILIDEQEKINLIKLHPSSFANRDDDQTGRPIFYTYRDQSYDLLPTPIQEYGVKFRYLPRHDDLEDDDDTNVFTNNAEDLIVLHVLAKMYAEDKQDVELASYYERLRKEEYKNLRDRTDGQVGSGYLQADSILQNTYI